VCDQPTSERVLSSTCRIRLSSSLNLDSSSCLVQENGHAIDARDSKSRARAFARQKPIPSSHQHTSFESASSTKSKRRFSLSRWETLMTSCTVQFSPSGHQTSGASTKHGTPYSNLAQRKTDGPVIQRLIRQ
jgi:hypothetical protein